MENDDMTRVTSFSVNRKVWDELKIRAIREQMTTGDLLNRLIMDYLKTPPPPRPELETLKSKKK